MNTTNFPILNDAVDIYYKVFTTPYEPWWIASEYPHSIPAVTVVLYLAMVFGLPKLMVRMGLGKGVNVGVVMPLWNLFLSAWSLVMALAMGIPYFSFLYREGFLEGLCDDRRILYEPSTMPIWAHVFVASKYAELLDTLLLILKNPQRPVDFLHWYHHTTVLLFTWYADLYQYAGAIFMIVNATIHTFMYWYYFRKETGYNPSWALPLTLGQISQMFIGIFVNGSWMYMRWVQKRNCPCREPEIITAACAAMYASYAYLFISFFFKRYGSKKGASNAKQEKKKQ